MTHSSDPRRPAEPTPADALRPVAAQRNDRLQADPEMHEGRATGSRIAVYGAAIVILLGAVFYGLSRQSSESTTTAQSNSPAAVTSSPGAPPSNVRDVTPNRDSQTTTGTAPTQVQSPPQSNPTGTEVDRSKGPAR